MLDYFHLSDKDMRVAKCLSRTSDPTLEQVKHIIALMPFESEIERRNRALVALTLLTGARDSAIASMKLKHVDLSGGSVHQDAREVRTKFSKSFTTFFFPVGEELLEILTDWVKYLREENSTATTILCFPATRIAGASPPFRGRWVGPEALEHCDADSLDLSRCMHRCWLTVL